MNKFNLKKKIIILFKNQTDFEFFYRNKNPCLELIKSFKNIKFLNLNNKYNQNVSKNYRITTKQMESLNKIYKELNG